jgi:AbrB family looped-hinge helix DNA binding protein
MVAAKLPSYAAGATAMRTTIDSAGRLVIPKEIRQQAGLVPGATVDVRFAADRVEIELVVPEAKLIEEGDLLVFHVDDPNVQMPWDIVDQVRDEIAREKWGS